MTDASAPTLIPPTPGTCATCFYGRQKTSDVGFGRLCRVHHPARASDTSPRGAWPVVADDDWCGEGFDATNYGSFSPVVVDQSSSAAQPVWIAPNPNPGGTLTHINAPGSYLVRSGTGWITGITVNSMASGSATMTCYDGIDATGTVIAVIDVSKSNPSPQTAAPWGFSVGFFVVLSAGASGADVTIVSHSV